MFLPTVFGLYLALPWAKAKNFLLVVASLFFYAYGEPVYVLLMLAVTVCNWLFGRLLVVTAASRGVAGTAATAADAVAGTATAVAARAAVPGSSVATSDRPVAFQAFKKRRWLIVAALVVNLGMLVVFKYTGWLVANVQAISGIHLPFSDPALPLGISFYVFHSISYLVDVYRGEVMAQKSLPRLMLYISFFPQLIAGPIIKYHDIADQLAQRRLSLEGVASGLRRLAVGLGKKVLIANPLGLVVDAIYSAPGNEINMPLAWLAAICYLGQIYFDFSGYSDMAIGMARMFGFKFKENFNYPYISTSVQEFWRRWHISLSTWFKEYLYIPLGGNRKGMPRAVLNRLIVFGLCGLWHGAAWTFLVWGLLHGLFLLLEQYLPIRKLPKALGVVYTLLVVTLTFVLFRSESFAQAMLMVGQMFNGWHFEPITMARLAWLADPHLIFVLAVAVIAALPLVPWIRRRLGLAADGVRRGTGSRLGQRPVPCLPPCVQRILCAGSYAGAFCLFGLALLALSSGGYNPFIYFRF